MEEDGPGASAAGTGGSPQASARVRRPLLGMQVDALTLQEACALCGAAVRTRAPLVVGVLNAAKLVRVQQDEALRQAIASCGLVIADGMSVVWASRVLRAPLPERVAGIDLFFSLLHEADRNRWSVYLLGGTEEVLQAVRQRLSRDYPELRIAGAQHGYFAEADEDSIVQTIRESRPDLLFVGISTPKKEFFLARHAPSLNVPLCHGVGGSFDVFAGKVERAPAGWQRWGLEWLYRLIQEPRRLWRRYLTTNTAFLWLVLRELVRRR